MPRKHLSPKASVILAAAFALYLTAHPAAAQELPANPELACSGPSTFERWGAGTAFPANNKPPRNGAGGQFARNFRIKADRGVVEDFNSSGGYDLVAAMASSGWTPGNYNSISPTGFSLRWTMRSQWDYSVTSYSVSRSPSGQFTYSFLQRDEDRNRLIFELYKSTGTCRLLNPV